MSDDELQWLKQAIGKGLMGLVALHLDGGPGADTVKHTAGVWFHVMKSWPIAWNEALDRPRLRAAFTALASQAARWPSPSQLRSLMPERAYPQPALPKSRYPPEKAKENLQKIKALMNEKLNDNLVNHEDRRKNRR